MIDETHKDRNASRKIRGWLKRNYAEAHEWFQNLVHHTLISARDINGSIPAACHTVLRDISVIKELQAVDTDYLLYWIKTYLYPVLDNYQHGDPRSVVGTDYASSNMDDEVEVAICATGAILIYGSSYSPYLNLIKNSFLMY